jgi:hypothetical protein
MKPFMNKKVFIDPKTNIPYCSFYLKGLIKLYGSRNIKFKSEPFSKLPPIGGNMRFIIQDEFKESKVFIHTNDSYDIEIEQYEWCDIYGNVNANFTHYPINDFPKQVSLVPSFAIRNFTLIETIYYSISNFLLVGGGMNDELADLEGLDDEEEETKAPAKILEQK